MEVVMGESIKVGSSNVYSESRSRIVVVEEMVVVVEGSDFRLKF